LETPDEQRKMREEEGKADEATKETMLQDRTNHGKTQVVIPTAVEDAHGEGEKDDMDNNAVEAMVVPPDERSDEENERSVVDSSRKISLVIDEMKKPRSREDEEDKQQQGKRRKGDDKATEPTIPCYKDTTDPLPEFVERGEAMSQAAIQKKYQKVNINSYPLSQRDMDEAIKAVSKSKKLPHSAKALQQMKNKIRGKQPDTMGRVLHTKSMKAANRRAQQARDLHSRYIQFEPYKEIEAKLQLYDSVTGIRYSVTGHGDEKDGHVRGGRFWVRLKGTGQEIPVVREWVVQNFNEDVVRAAFKHGTGDFIDLPNSTVAVELDNSQIQKVKYVDASSPKMQPYFCGILSDGQVRRLPDEFVHNNFTEAFITRVMEEGTKESATKHKFSTSPQELHEQGMVALCWTPVTPSANTCRRMISRAFFRPLQVRCITWGCIVWRPSWQLLPQRIPQIRKGV